MIAEISLIIALLSLLVAGAAYYRTIRKGRLRMTRPTTIFFGHDRKDPKIYLRTLLFSTSMKGQVIESMHVKLHRAESVQTFNIWIYGKKSQVVRGSGLFVGQEGVAHNHHFLLPKATNYEFMPGEYRLEVYASLLGKPNPPRLYSVELQVDEPQAQKLKESSYGLYFDWGPESGQYHPHLSTVPLTPEELADLLRI